MAWKPFGKRPTVEEPATEFDDRIPTKPTTDLRVDQTTSPDGYATVDTLAQEQVLAQQRQEEEKEILRKRQEAVTAPEGHTVITDADIVSSEPATQTDVPKDFGEGAGIIRRPTEPRIPTVPPPAPDAAMFRKGRK